WIPEHMFRAVTDTIIEASGGRIAVTELQIWVTYSNGFQVWANNSSNHRVGIADRGEFGRQVNAFLDTSFIQANEERQLLFESEAFPIYIAANAREIHVRLDNPLHSF